MESGHQALLEAVNQGVIDVIATDHAPHTLSEKNGPYTKAASGGPMVQHSLTVMLELAERGMISMEKIVEGMCHAPAELFRIENRGSLYFPESPLDGNKRKYSLSMWLVAPGKPNVHL